MISRVSWLAFVITVLVTFLCLKSCTLFAGPDNGFDLSNSTIPKQLILPGGPARDGIPAIDSPRFESAAVVDWLEDEDQVLSISINNEHRAYPISILNWHEIVNDRIGSQSVVISYCPLCGTGMAFNSQVQGETLDFGVSGLLYNSDVLLYDRQSESLWSQLKHEAVSGPSVGAKLEHLPMSQLTWAEWKQRYPTGQVLSRDTGFLRDYSRSPYGDYNQSLVLYFPVEFLSQRYHPKERVLGVEVAGKYRAYPFSELAKSGGGELSEIFNGRELRIKYNSESRTGEVIDEKNSQLWPTVNAFWFAWFTFHSDTSVFTAKGIKRSN
ncbi:MAG: DUF3179 domain-containing protein [Neptuniibacter sp.]